MTTTEELHESYALARASWAYATGQDWRTYDDLTATDLDAWAEVIARSRKN